MASGVTTANTAPEAATYPAIPEPTLDPVALLATIKRLKETVEMLTGQRSAGGLVWSVPDAIRRVQDLQAKVVTSIEETTAGEANAKIYVSAEANKTGYSAVYGWRLTAGNIKAGMYTLVKSDGTARMAFEAAQFQLMDPGYNSGLPVQVFNYSNGKFTFGVPVEINTSSIPGYKTNAMLQFNVDGTLAAPATTIPGYSLDASGNLNGSKIVNGTVTGGKIGTGSIVNNHIGEAIFDSKIASIDGNKIFDLTVGSAKIAAAAIDTTKIANAAITNAKIADLVVDNAKIANLSVNNIKITNGAVTNSASATVAYDGISKLLQAGIYARANSWILVHVIMYVPPDLRGNNSYLYFSNTGAIVHYFSDRTADMSVLLRYQTGSEGTYYFHTYCHEGGMSLVELSK